MPATPPETTYDVFISYSHTDSDWVFDWLVLRLKDAGLKVCTDQESFELGVPAPINMENAVATSRHTLLVLTPAYLTSEWTMYEQILTQTQDPIGLRQRTIPVLRQPCDLPMRIAMLTYADLTDRRDAEAELAKIVRAIGGTPQLPQAGQTKVPPPSASSPAQPAYNTAVVRELLMATFSDEELMAFCFDNFRPVYEEFATGMSRTQKVQMFVAYCERRGEMAGLLARAKSANPYQYTRFEDRLCNAQVQPPKPSDTIPAPDSLPPNPFAGVGTVKDAVHFVGREAELRRLKTLLQVGSVALLGEPQIGMSSLLGQVARTWLGTVIGPLNCQELDSRNDFYEYLAGKLGLSGYAWPPIREKLKMSEVLFLVDELDAGPAHGIKLEDLGRFRAVASANHGFRMVIVSHHPLRQVFPNTGPDSPGYSFLQPLTIGVLNDADARKLLEHPWAPNVPQFEPTIRDDLLKLAGGHPFKLHRAAFHRYETLIDPTYDWLAAYRQDLENLL
jgi:hypothetical protein